MCGGPITRFLAGKRQARAGTTIQLPTFTSSSRPSSAPSVFHSYPKGTEGTIAAWRYEAGDEVDVLLESKENEEGMVVLSKWKADRKMGWERIMNKYAGMANPPTTTSKQRGIGICGPTS